MFPIFPLYEFTDDAVSRILLQLPVLSAGIWISLFINLVFECLLIDLLSFIFVVTDFVDESVDIFG